jgi:two-component system phosphate regulon response regulator PhoB
MGSIEMDLGARRVRLDGDEVELTPTEFRLLEALMQRPGRALSRIRLLELAWELDAGIARDIQTRTVDMHVRRLRTKLGPAADAIETVRGFGYRFRDPEAR